MGKISVLFTWCTLVSIEIDWTSSSQLETGLSCASMLRYLANLMFFFGVSERVDNARRDMLCVDQLAKALKTSCHYSISR